MMAGKVYYDTAPQRSFLNKLEIRCITPCLFNEETMAGSKKCASCKDHVGTNTFKKYVECAN